MVTFLVTGRLNLFQANAIGGNTTSGLVPTQFAGSTPSTGLSPGGTYVISQGGSQGTGQIGVTGAGRIDAFVLGWVAIADGQSFLPVLPIFVFQKN
jgi:hypothetical protein